MLAATSATEPPTLSENRCNLTAYLDSIWQQYFWKSRLGLIRLSEDKKTTFIGINSLLQLPQVPECVLTTTIAHELAHYAHGFGSPLPRICQHPHANGIVDRELERRELGEQLRCCNDWIDQYWYSFYDTQRSLICSLRSSLAKARSAQKYL
jgi:hypothetical protein